MWTEVEESLEEEVEKEFESCQIDDERAEEEFLSRQLATKKKQQASWYARNRETILARRKETETSAKRQEKRTKARDRFRKIKAEDPVKYAAYLEYQRAYQRRLREKRAADKAARASRFFVDPNKGNA